MVKGLTKEHSCTTIDTDNNGDLLGEGDGEAGYRWGKGEKAGKIVTT